MSPPPTPNKPAISPEKIPVINKEIKKYKNSNSMKLIIF